MSSLMTTPTVAVFGASYGGSRAAQVLAAGLPKSWRVVLVDKNSHANHLYALPRMAVLPGHEEKAFVPYTNVFYPEHNPEDPPVEHNHLRVHGLVTSIHPNTFTYKPLEEHLREERSQKALSRKDQKLPSEESMRFDYAVYAFGAHLPAPVDVWAHEGEAHGKNTGEGVISKNGTKVEGVEWLRKTQERIKRAKSVLLIGGGAMGIQFASDIQDVYPEKKVTLIHSRNRLLPIYKQEVHDEVIRSLEGLGVQVILGERVDLNTAKEVTYNDKNERIIKTTSGRELDAELVFLCTGQTPNTSFLKAFAPEAIDHKTQEASVLRTMQIAKVPEVRGNWAAELESRVQRLDLDENISPSDVKQETSVITESGKVFREGPLQISPSIPAPKMITPLHSHFFVIGDAANAFGAIKAGHTAYHQAEVAAKNIIKLIKAGEGNGDSQQDACITEHSVGVSENSIPNETTGSDMNKLEEYNPGLPAIKITLGRKHYVGQINGMVGARNDGHDDLDSLLIWRYYGADTSDVSL